MKNVSPTWISTQCLWLSLTASLAGAQPPSPDSRPCEKDPAYRAMDFWIGTWDVETEKGRHAGVNRIELILGSCILLENWTGVNGYEGKSFNLYHPSTSKWEQIWVDNMGQMTKYEGEARDGNIYYQANSQDAEGKPILRRMTFFPKQPDGLRQLGETSKDGGKTWTTEYDLHYKRKGT